MNIPELNWYTDVETPLEMNMEGIFPEDYEEITSHKADAAFRGLDKLILKDQNVIVPQGKTKKSTRRISVSDSESDIDIHEVLEGVVRDYAATHSRTTRVTERSKDGKIN